MSVQAPSKVASKDLPVGFPVPDEPKPAVEPEPFSHPKPPEPAPTFSVHAKDGGLVALCDPSHKPPGLIAPHETTGVGVWVKTLAGWVKTNLTAAKAFGVVRRSKTAADAIDAMISP